MEGRYFRALEDDAIDERLARPRAPPEWRLPAVRELCCAYCGQIAPGSIGVVQ